MTLLAIDPGRSFKGEASIGYALFNGTTGKELERGSLSFEQLTDYATGFQVGRDFDLLFSFLPISEVVIEDYVNNAQSKGGQRNGTSECIGSVETYCLITGVPFSRQEPAALGPAKMHAPAGSWKPLKHLRHEDSAYLHGYEYLVRKGVLQAAGLSSTL